MNGSIMVHARFEGEYHSDSGLMEIDLAEETVLLLTIVGRIEKRSMRKFLFLFINVIIR